MTSQNITSTGVIVNADEVLFDANGRAIIEDDSANKFIKETLTKEGAIEISAPGREMLNIICSNGPTNIYCPQNPRPQK